MLKLQKCLCCTLRTGTLVIGYLKISLIVIAVIGLIAGLCVNTEKGVTIALIVSLFVTLLVLLINGLMVYGVHKGRPRFLIAWLALYFLGLLLYAVFIVMACVQSLSNDEDPVTYVMIFVMLPLTLVLSCYLYLVVYSHYKELSDAPQHSRLYDRATYEFSDTQVAIVTEK